MQIKRVVPKESYLRVGFDIYSNRGCIAFVGFGNTTLVDPRVYVTFKLKKCPTKGELRGMKKLLDQEAADIPMVAQAREEKNCRFLTFFGFVKTAQLDDISVYERVG